MGIRKFFRDLTSERAYEKFYLEQPYLAESIRRANELNTPTADEPIGADLYGTAFNNEWGYRSIIGMFIYLAAKTCPDISYAMHQDARFYTILRTAVLLRSSGSCPISA